MRKEFKMTQAEYEAILEACKPVPYMIVGGFEVRSSQEKLNAAWDALGRKYCFVGRSVAPIAEKSDLYFTAEVETKA